MPKYNHEDVELLLESAVASIADRVTGNLGIMETQVHEVCSEQGLGNEVEAELSALFQWGTIKGCSICAASWAARIVSLISCFEGRASVPSLLTFNNFLEMGAVVWGHDQANETAFF